MAAKVRALQQWCKRQCDGYRDVSITNMTSSWKSGLAFCAIIHRYRPDLINYDMLSKSDIFENNKLAFDVASDYLGIPALLDPEDMLTMAVPDKLCIITYVSQYYNYFHDKTPGSAQASAVSSQHLNQPDRPTILLSTQDSVKKDISSSTGHRYLAPSDDFLRDMSANALHRRGSVVNDTCYKCGQRVYLLERHLASTGQLFHRHCYRDSERTATLQRAASRRGAAAPSSKKENLLPPEVAPTGRTGRRKSSPFTENNESAAPPATSAEECAVKKIRDYQANAKPKKVDIPEVVGVSRYHGVAPQQKASTPVTATNQIAKAKSTETLTGRASQKQLAQSANHLITSRKVSPTVAPKPQTTAAATNARADDASTTGSKLNFAMKQGEAEISKDTARSFAAVVAQPSDQYHQDSVLSVVDRAHPALSATKYPGATKTKTISPAVAAISKTTDVLSPSSVGLNISSIDRSCDIISVTEPTRLVFKHAAPCDKQQILVTPNGSDASQKQSNLPASITTKYCRLASPSKDQDSTSSVYESLSDRDSLSDVSFASLSPCLSNDSAFATPPSSVFAEFGANFTRPQMVTKLRQYEPPQPCSSNIDTTTSVQRRSSMEKEDDLSTKTLRLYRPKSLENIIVSPCGWNEKMPDNDNGVLPVNKKDVTVQLGSRQSTGIVGDGVYFGPRRLKNIRWDDRSKSTCDLFSKSSELGLRDDKETKLLKARVNAAKIRNETMVKGLLENLTKARERKQQESQPDLAMDKEMATPVSGVVAYTSSHPAVTLRSERSVEQRKPASSVTSAGDSSTSHSHPPAGRLIPDDKTSKQNTDVSVTLPPCDQLRVTTPTANGIEPQKSAAKNKYLTKWQAECQSKQETHHGQMNSRYPRQETPPARKVISPIKTSSTLTAASKFSKSVNDLSQITKPADAEDERCGQQQMTEWQLEVERRRAARASVYVDPEKLPRFRDHKMPEKIKAVTSNSSRKSMMELDENFTLRSKNVSNMLSAGLNKSKMKSNLSASVDNLATCNLTVDILKPSLQAGPTSLEPDDNGRDANADASSDAESSSGNSSPRYMTARRSTTSSENYYESIGELQKSTGADVDTTHQNTEAGELDEGTLQRLDELGASLREIEFEGRLLEERIRSGLSVTKALSGLFRSDGKRPNGLTFVHWSNGEALCWDVTITCALADSYITAAVREPGAAAELAASRKEEKYAALDGQYIFEPIAIETLGIFNTSARQLLSNLETDEAIDDKTDEMMVEWFKLVRKRHELVREESALIYALRQQELESLHHELQNQLQSLMSKPDEIKSRADWQLETSLLRELVDTVTKRSTIVENMETDRLRYQEEDEELEEMIAASGVLNQRRASGSSWAQKSSVRKMKTRSSDKDVSQKKKKFSIFSLARKSLARKKSVRAARNVPVTAH